MTTLSRRQFVTSAGAAGLGLLIGCGQLPWQAQAPPRVFRVALLSGGEPGVSHLFKEGLRDHGHVDGQNVVIDVRDAKGTMEDLEPLALELVALRPDVIATVGVAATQAAQNATNTVPIVQLGGSDLVKLGLAANLARPGGNVTGLTNMVDALVGKRLELLRDAVGGLSRMAVPAQHQREDLRWAESSTPGSLRM